MRGAGLPAFSAAARMEGPMWSSMVAGPVILDTLGAPAPCNSGFGDPVVLWDPLADRWILSEFSGTANALCVYVSQTANPVTGGWFAYTFFTPDFPDYPKYAVWPDAYYVGTNEGNAPPAYALDRARMLAGLSATFQRFTAPGLAGFGLGGQRRGEDSVR